jgi:hypothetical protein
MKRIQWCGWLITGFLLLQNAATGLAAPGGTNPMDGRLLQQSNGTFYVYHDGLKFSVEPADVGDQVINAIPTASSDEWKALFTSSSASKPVVPSEPQPIPTVPGYS